MELSVSILKYIWKVFDESLTSNLNFFWLIEINIYLKERKYKVVDHNLS